MDNGETSEFSRFLEENVPKVQQYRKNIMLSSCYRIMVLSLPCQLTLRLSLLKITKNGLSD